MILNDKSHGNSALNILQTNNRKDLLKKRNISMNYRKNSNALGSTQESGYVLIGID